MIWEPLGGWQGHGAHGGGHNTAAEESERSRVLRQAFGVFFQNVFDSDMFTCCLFLLHEDLEKTFVLGFPPRNIKKRRKRDLQLMLS